MVGLCPVWPSTKSRSFDGLFSAAWRPKWQVLRQMPTVVHLLVKNPNDLYRALVLAIENDMPAKGTRTTAGKQLFPGTALAAFWIVADLIQSRLDQSVVTFELKFPPFLQRISKQVLNILGGGYGKLIRQWIRLHLSR